MQPQSDKNVRTLITMLCIAIAMIGVAYAAVPLYRIFCQVTGFGGTPLTAEALPDVILDREVTVSFTTATANDLPWEFSAETRSLKVNVGAKGIVKYTAENMAATPTAGTAVFNVTPLKAGPYFHKIQCFCFEKQIIQPGKEATMPVVFYVDPSIADNPSLDGVTDITLSYTYYAAESEGLEKALEDFYNQTP